MTGAVVVALLACAALAWVAAPIRAGERGEVDDPGDAAELEGKKRAALSAIIDMEDERAVGKLSADDFDALRGEYEAEAVAALLALDSLRASSAESDDDLEAEIAAIKRRLGDAGSGGDEPGRSAGSGRGAPE